MWISHTYIIILNIYIFVHTKYIEICILSRFIDKYLIDIFANIIKSDIYSYIYISNSV